MPAFRWPWVARAVADVLREQLADARADRARLLDLVATMRTVHGFAPSAAGKIVPPPRAIEDVAKERAESVFVANARADILRRTGVDVQTADREARRLRDEADVQQPT